MNESAAAVSVTTKSQLDNYYRWAEPDTDITVFLKLDTVDRLQLDVLRAVESSSNGRNEVGGVLLGRTEYDESRRRTFVDDFEPVPCEHPAGPDYAVTAEVAAQFEAALALDGARQTPSVVGYYRSHNRDGLFLSADDLRLIHCHFRNPDQLFLLIKTLPKGACTAGFFFWKDGHIQSEFTDSEAPLIPLSISSARRVFSWREDAADIPGATPAAVLHAGEDRPAIASSQTGRSRDLIHAVVVTGVAAAVTFAALSFRETRPAHHQAPPVPHPAPELAADIAPAASTPVPPPVPVVRQSALSILPPPKTVLPPVRDKRPTPLNKSNPLTPAPPPESSATRSPVAGEPGTVPPSKPLSAATEGPPNIAPPNPGVTTIAPLVPVTPPPIPESPVSTVEAPRIDPGTRGGLPVAKPDASPSSAPSAVHTFVGPRIIHQVAPAVPRGVGPLITNDVQVDVAVVIDANGKVIDARIAATKGAAAGLLTIEALKAAQRFRFQPARDNSRNVTSSMVLTFRFVQTAK